MTDTAARISAWAREQGLADAAATDVERLGAGESYDAWRVGTWVVRMSRRPLAELPKPMAVQLDVLALVPEDIGPRPVLVEESPDVLGAPFVVTTYVPGHEVPFAGWTDDLLVAHARQLARLHERPFERASFSLAERWRDSLDWWRAHDPGALDPVADLVPRVTSFVEERDALFTRRTRFAVVHGDLVVTNVVVDRGVPRYIDWEWGEVGDPAQDLALFGGTIACAPWYLPLTGERSELFLGAYRDAAGADPDLEARRDAYEVMERLLTTLYFRQTGRHPSAVDAITDALRARLR